MPNKYEHTTAHTIKESIYADLKTKKDSKNFSNNFEYIPLVSMECRPTFVTCLPKILSLLTFTDMINSA